MTRQHGRGAGSGDRSRGPFRTRFLEQRVHCTECTAVARKSTKRSRSAVIYTAAVALSGAHEEIHRYVQQQSYCWRKGPDVSENRAREFRVFRAVDRERRCSLSLSLSGIVLRQKRFERREASPSSCLHPITAAPHNVPLRNGPLVCPRAASAVFFVLLFVV